MVPGGRSRLPGAGRHRDRHPSTRGASWAACSRASRAPTWGRCRPWARPSSTPSPSPSAASPWRSSSARGSPSSSSAASCASAAPRCAPSTRSSGPSSSCPWWGSTRSAGVLAIAIPYAGVFAKVYAEILQEADRRPMQALPPGSTSVSRFCYGGASDHLAQPESLHLLPPGVRPALQRRPRLHRPADPGLPPGDRLPGGALRRGRGPALRLLPAHRVAALLGPAAPGGALRRPVGRGPCRRTSTSPGPTSSAS